jgi:hypothetical protein
MSRTRLWYVAAIALLPASVTAQDTTRAPTVTALRRVAEALDGYPARGSVYVVLDSIQEVRAIVSSRPQADSVLRLLRGRGEIHGPLRASPSASRNLVMRCVHMDSAMQGICNHFRPIPLSEIDSMSLVIRTRDGASRTISLPRRADAIFLTMSAVDKFVIPYYTRVDGVDAAAALRRRMLADDRRP